MKCRRCHEPMAHLWVSYMDLFDDRYPRTPGRTTSLVTHTECADEHWYQVGAPLPTVDWIDFNLVHLSQKRWFGWGQGKALRHYWEIQRDHMVRREYEVLTARGVVHADARRISPTTRAKVLERDKFQCRRCGIGPDVIPLEVDHIYPVTRGGTAKVENLQTLCAVCNAGKAARCPAAHDVYLELV